VGTIYKENKRGNFDVKGKI